MLILGSLNCDYRVREALRLFGDLTPDYVCSGGNLSAYTDAAGKPLTEAAYMRQVLLNSGVPTERIFLDELSANTGENLANTRPWLEKGNACIVTAGFHTRRVDRLLAEAGLKAAVLPAYGPSAGKDNWHRSAQGIAIILTELEKLDPDYAHEAARELLEQLCRIGRERA